MKLATKNLLSAAVIAMIGTTSSALASDHDIQVTVKGMVCAFCAQGITKKFSADPAVSHVDVSLEKHLVTLALKGRETISDEKISGVLRDAGYTVEKISRQ